MKNILLLPIFRFGDKLNSITILTIETFSRINKKDFNFIINLDIKTYDKIDKYYLDKIKDMEKSFAYAGKNIFKFIVGLLTTLKYAKKSDYLLCESEYFYSVLYSYIIHIFSRKPLIYRINRIWPDMHKENNYIHFIIYKYIFKKVKKSLILNNEYMINEFTDIFGKDIKLFKVMNGVDVNKFYTSNNKIYDLIYIGSIDERKNSFILPEIIERLKKFNENIKLLIISHWGEIDKLRIIINQKNLGRNIDIKNYVTEEEKREYLAKSRLMVFPTKYEGFGIVIAEALASYLPVILFDVPTLKIFDKGVVKAKPFDIDEYTEKIIYLLQNENIRQELGKLAREEALKRFDYSIVAEIENNAIKNAIKDDD